MTRRHHSKKIAPIDRTQAKPVSPQITPPPQKPAFPPLTLKSPPPPSMQKGTEKPHELMDILRDKGWKTQVNDEWTLRLSVDSQRPSQYAPPRNYGYMGIGTVGPTLTWERKF